MSELASADAWNDYLYWQDHDNPKVKCINQLIKSIERDGCASGIGKPEPLKHDLSGYWSRRINDEHRIIYRIDDDNVYIASCKDHYS